MPNEPQNKGRSKVRCEYTDCGVTFGRNAERRRHVKEKHGPLIYCGVSGCSWTARRVSRLRAHFEKAHISRATNLEFRAATTGSSTSSRSRYFNIDTNFGPSAPLTHFNNPSWHQDQNSQFTSESYAPFMVNEAPHTPYNPMVDLSVAARTKAQFQPHRVLRPCRVRRRASSTTTCTSSSASPPLTERSSVTDSTLHFYSIEHNNSTIATQGISEPIDAKGMTKFFRSLNLDYAIRRIYPNQQ